MQQAYRKVPREVLALFEESAARVRAFHQRQRAESWFEATEDGTLLGQLVTPIGRVGLYVPGGKAAYPSSVLMNAIPAQVAGVPVARHLHPGAGGRSQPARSRRRRHARSRGDLPHRGRPGGRGAGLRHGDDPAGGQDRRAGQHLRGDREENGFRRGRHRHDRRAERDPHPRRRRGRPAAHRGRPALAGRARRAGDLRPGHRFAEARRSRPGRGRAPGRRAAPARTSRAPRCAGRV